MADKNRPPPAQDRKGAGAGHFRRRSSGDGPRHFEETAYFLDLTVKSEKPIVLIGAQRNASEHDFDGPRNLLNAVRICVAPEAKNMGAMICLTHQINEYPARAI